MKKIQTLCMIHRHPKILLGMKKRGFGQGRWNGFGGKVSPGETILEAAKREVLEETNIQINLNECDKCGIVQFEFHDKPDTIEVHFFRVGEFEGNPTESEEMLPKWFNVDEIPLEEMWPDDKYWMPLFLEGKKFKGRFLFGEGDSVLEKNLEIVEGF
ncbi:MAG: 8-oxo-dGTP diphosphatase [Patescibacteria group bacterium]